MIVNVSRYAGCTEGAAGVTKWKWIGIATLGVSSIVAVLSSVAAQERRSQSRTAFSGKLPALDGQRLEVTLVEVTYPPSGANPAHRHPCPVIGYVLEGALRMHVKGQRERTFKPGETFFESPSDVHLVSANASQDAPARFLAYFVCDRETPLSVPAADAEKRP
jgi:quercetin dioxygenase-like cupin family protein